MTMREALAAHRSDEPAAAQTVAERIVRVDGGLDRKIDNLVMAIENAPESAAVLARKLAQSTSEREEAAAKLKCLTTTTRLSVADVTALIDQLGGVVKTLQRARTAPAATRRGP